MATYLDNYTDNIIIGNGNAEDDSIVNFANYVTIAAGDGNNTVENGDGSEPNSANHVLIQTGTGNDNITNSSGEYNTISSGNGNDYITNASETTRVVIDAGAGNDVIVNAAINGTISGGAGDDNIQTYLEGDNGANVYVYNEGDGHDTITNYAYPEGGGAGGYSNNYTLQINSSVGWSQSTINNNDLLITVGEGSILLVGAAGSAVNIIGTESGEGTTGENTVTDDTNNQNTVNGETTDNTNNGGITTNDTTQTDTTTTTNNSAPTDVVFLVDNTGSMGGYIESVKNAITNFANTLKDSGRAYRLGLVEFGDNNDSAIKSYGFASDVENFKGWVARIASTGGGDLPESGLEAVNTALTMDFQPGNNKRFVVVSDASFHNQGESGDGNSEAYLNTADIQTALSGVKMDVVGRVDTTCKTEWEPLATITGGKFYDITKLGYGLDEIADDISIHVNIDLSTVPEGLSLGWVVVSTSTDAAGNVTLLNGNATFKTEPEADGETLVGYVDGKNYVAVGNSPWRQIVTAPEGWQASGTNMNDTFKVAGNNITLTGGAGNDNIDFNENHTGVNIVDVAALQRNGAGSKDDVDRISFANKITPGNLNASLNSATVDFYTEDNTVSFSLSRDAALDQERLQAGEYHVNANILNCKVKNAGSTNTIRELMTGEGQYQLHMAQYSFGFTPPEDSWQYQYAQSLPLNIGKLELSADMAEDFGSPTLEDISPANFAVTADSQNLQDATNIFAPELNFVAVAQENNFA